MQSPSYFFSFGAKLSQGEPLYFSKKGSISSEKQTGYHPSESLFVPQEVPSNTSDKNHFKRPSWNTLAVFAVREGLIPRPSSDFQIRIGSEVHNIDEWLLKVIPTPNDEEAKVSFDEALDGFMTKEKEKEKEKVATQSEEIKTFGSAQSNLTLSVSASPRPAVPSLNLSGAQSPTRATDDRIFAAKKAYDRMPTQPVQMTPDEVIEDFLQKTVFFEALFDSCRYDAYDPMAFRNYFLETHIHNQEDAKDLFTLLFLSVAASVKIGKVRIADQTKVTTLRSKYKVQDKVSDTAVERNKIVTLARLSQAFADLTIRALDEVSVEKLEDVMGRQMNHKIHPAFRMFGLAPYMKMLGQVYWEEYENWYYEFSALINSKRPSWKTEDTTRFLNTQCKAPKKFNPGVLDLIKKMRAEWEAYKSEKK